MNKLKTLLFCYLLLNTIAFSFLLVDTIDGIIKNIPQSYQFGISCTYSSLILLVLFTGSSALSTVIVYKSKP